MIRLEIQAICSGVLIYFLGSLCSVLSHAYNITKTTPQSSSYTIVSLVAILASWIIISSYMNNRKIREKSQRSVSDFLMVSSVLLLTVVFSI